jgi:hypothetical protein
MPGSELVEILADQQPGETLPPKTVDAYRDVSLTRIIAESNIGPTRFAAAVVRSKAELAGTICLIALRRWQLEQKELLTDLRDITKAAGMAAVPNDPYVDRPMRLTVLNGEPVIYSVGPDQKDDHAKIEWKGDHSQSGDMIFRIPQGSSH